MQSKTHRFQGKSKARQSASAAQPSTESYVAGVPLARVIPRALDERAEAVLLTDPRSVAAERFRRLASTLQGGQDASRVVVVSSAIPNEGKTTVAMNLALSFAADADGDTLVIDADLRRPTIHTWLKQPPGLGLSDVLSGRVGLEHAIHKLTNSSLNVLPGGSACPDPLGLLSSSTTRELIDELRTKYRQVIIDTPPIVPFSDANVVGGFADGVVVVARVGTTVRKVFEQGISLITAPVLGVVLNQYQHNIADGRVSNDSYYSKYYGREQ
jgi:capsular exopolysaccharide synthesis family protein